MKPKHLLLFFALAGTTIYLSCRKTDQVHEQNGLSQFESIEDRFFNSNRTADPNEKALVEFIKRKNEKDHFVEKTVSKIGYPRWDKAFSTTAKSKISGRGNTDSSLATFYIPFVRDSQNYVNASMVIKAYPSDTSFFYKCDWQYSQRQNSQTSYKDSAEYYAIFFMVLDKVVFGHTEFEITDTTLFKHSSHKPLSVRLDSMQISGRNNLYEMIEVCQETAISWQDCPYIPTIGHCYGPGGACDDCPQCKVYTTWTYCWTEWIEVGGGGGGTGGTGGGSSGSGGGSGGPNTPPDNPNPCPPTTPTSARVALYNCGPGWTPTGGGGSNPPPTEPIDSLLKKYSELVNKYRDSLSSLCESEHKERFFNIVNYNNQLDTFRVLTGPSDDEVKPNYYMTGGRILKGSWHYHPKYSDGTPGSWPSGGDVAQLFDKPEGFVMIIDADNARYALVVENPAKMNAWMKIFGNGPNMFPEKVENLVLADPRVWSTGSDYIQMTKEKLLTALGSSTICGIGLYQASSGSGTSFIKIN